jgi:hypothetical protein
LPLLKKPVGPLGIHYSNALHALPRDDVEPAGNDTRACSSNILATAAEGVRVEIAPPHRHNGGPMSQRDEYIEKLKAQLDQWNAEVAKWEARSKSAQAGMRADYERQLAAFRHQRDQAMEQMRLVQAASGDAWVDLVRGADDAWTKMREAFEKTRSHFQK